MQTVKVVNNVNRMALQRMSLMNVGQSMTQSMTSLFQDKIHDQYLLHTQQNDTRLLLDALEPKDRLNLMKSDFLLNAAVKGNYGIKDEMYTNRALDVDFQKAGMKSAHHDSLPKQSYELKISCSKLPKRSEVIECDPICIVQRRGEGEFDAGTQYTPPAQDTPPHVLHGLHGLHVLHAHADSLTCFFVGYARISANWRTIAVVMSAVA